MSTQTNFTKLMIAFGAILTFIMFLSSCKDDNDTETQGAANVQVIHSAEGTGAVDLYIDNMKVNSQAVVYSQSSGYIQTVRVIKLLR